MEAIVSIDEKGRVDLGPLIEALHFTAPGELQATVTEGRIELIPVQKSAEVRFLRENGILVAENDVPFDAVAAIQAVRNERL